MTQEKAPTWFMVVAIIALIWNAMGVMAYLAQVYMTPEAIALLPEAEQALYANIPAWYTAAFATAVFAGALGCLLLVVKKKLAGPVLILSLVAVLAQMYYNFFVSDSMDVYGPGAAVMPLMVLIISFLLVGLASKAKNSGWLS
jgi:hypothetical protein